MQCWMQNEIISAILLSSIIFQKDFLNNDNENENIPFLNHKNMQHVCTS